METCEGILIICKLYSTPSGSSCQVPVMPIHSMGVACIYHTSQVHSSSLEAPQLHNIQHPRVV
jgi:hypothetical protein